MKRYLYKFYNIFINILKLQKVLIIKQKNYKHDMI